MVERFGFGELGHEIFSELDADQTGTVSYVELMEAIGARTGHFSKNCQNLLAACAFENVTGDESSPSKQLPTKQFPSTPWEAKDSKTMRQHVRKVMAGQLARPYDVWQALLIGGAAQPNSPPDSRRPGLTCEEFCAAMRGVLGFAGDEDVLELVYSQMDDTESNSVSFDEFCNWMNGKTQRRALARSISLQKTRRHDEKPLDGVHWTVGRLRTELQTLLNRHGLSSLDLLMAYDKSDDESLSRKEFTWMMRKVLDNDAAWTSGFKEVALSIFDRISGGDGEMDIEEFERWLRRDTKTQGPDPTFMMLKPSSGLPKIKPSRSHAKADRAKRAKERAKEQGLPSSISLPSLGHRSRARRSRMSEDSMDSSTTFGDGSHSMANELRADSLSGRALAARWLMPNASTAKVLAVESDVQLPVLLDGPAWTPKWRLLGGSSPTSSSYPSAKSTQTKKKAPPKDEVKTQTGASGQLLSKLAGPTKKPPALSISPSWDNYLHEARDKMAEAMKRAPVLSPSVQR
jgi:hypothetical protein